MAPTVGRPKRINYSLPKNAISRDYRITRSKLPGDSHVSIPYEGRRARCIVCRKSFMTKAVLKFHFEQAHQVLPQTQGESFTNQLLPAFTHPSCWPAPVKLDKKEIRILAARKQRLEDTEPPNPKYDRKSVIQDYRDQCRFADVGARNEKEYKDIKDVQEYRIWNWWVEQQEVDMDAALENEEAHLRTTGNAGAIDRSLQLDANTYHLTTTLPVAQEHEQAVYDDNQARLDSISASRGNAELHWASQRAAGAGGRLTTDCELPTRGSLKPKAVLQSLADANIALVERDGETANSRHTMAIAAEEFLVALRAQPHLDKLQQYRNNFRNKDLRQRRNFSRMGARELATREKKQAIWYMNEFRQDRARIYDTIEQAVEEYFGPFPDVQIQRPSGPFNTIILAAYAYAKRLGANAVMEMLDRYFGGRGERLVAYLDNRYGEGQR